MEKVGLSVHYLIQFSAVIQISLIVFLILRKVIIESVYMLFPFEAFAAISADMI